jgi:cyclopropane fatty-acyl-phospholipid synthase-like methyltransferase
MREVFRPGYAANLVSSWIPALDGVQDKLARGEKVADVGCGKGASTVLMAKAFPKSHIYGFNYDDTSIEAARESAKRQGVAERVMFEVAKAKEFPGRDYDFVAVFDCLHDLGDPVGAAARVRSALSDDGSWMIVEPFANDDLQDNLNPVGRVYYSFLDVAVHTLLSIAGGGDVSGSSGRREANTESRQFRRF